MKDVLGFTPRYSTREAFDDFVARQGLHGPLSARRRAVPSRTGSATCVGPWRAGPAGSRRCRMPDARVIPIGGDDRPRRAVGRATRWPRVPSRASGERARRRAGAPLLGGTPPPVEAAAPARPARRRTAEEGRAAAGHRPPEPVETVLDEPATGAPPADAPVLPEWERKVAGALAFVRRRLTGDVEVDEFGFDPELTDHVLLALLRPLYEHYFRVEVRGHRERPGRGRRAGRRQPLRHRAARLGDDPDRAARPPPGAPAPADARRRPGLPDARSSASWPARAARRWPATPTPSGCSARASWSGSGPRASRASASRSPSATSCSGSAGAASCRRRCAAGVPIVPCSIVGAEEIYPILGNVKTLARLLGLPYVPVTPTFPLARPARR